MWSGRRTVVGSCYFVSRTTPANLSPEVLEFLKENSAEVITYPLTFDYDYWTADEIITSILPEELVNGAPSGFATVGHIAHLNLNAEYLPYKHLIGQIILEKTSDNIRTVVNKTDTISNQFRVFQMEVLAGDRDFVVKHHESNCAFTFDFREVYWNSRLQTEHGRLVNQFTPEDLVADVFAGVGPFSIPAAKKGCAVFANDLNPMSYNYLRENISDNKVSDLVRASCEDGRTFIRSVFNRAFDTPFLPIAPKVSRNQLRKAHASSSGGASRSRSPKRIPEAPKHATPPRNRITHLAMNLPDSAIEFLDAFRGVLAHANAGERALSGLYGAPHALPLVHCYCFTRESEYEKAKEDIWKRVEERLGHPLGEEASLHLVRSVAPNKEMYCISFRLPHEVAFAA